MSKITFAYISVFALLVGGILYAAADKGNSSLLEKYAKIEIREGDTLWDLAEELKGRHDLTSTEFVEWVNKENRMTSLVIKPGEELYIPVKKEEVYKIDAKMIASEE
ncbi:cell division suppressor protein YneA [Metabacillus sp. 84]|uniref:cell division suppressor protein YneA n=1 Tax=unclassified Metabacillus TaxID=2675274 RepID=UPI003CF060EF